MSHDEIIRILPEADTAVLFLHGIVGSPEHFRDVLPLIDRVPSNWSVYALRYPGHGGTVDDFARSSMKQWRAYAKKVFNDLSATHDRVILVGHSMGNLFSMQLGLEHPDKIPFIFMLAAPMRPFPSGSGILNLFKLGIGKPNMSSPIEASTATACGIVLTRKLWKYVKWVPRMLELFAEISRTEKKMGQLKIPCVALQSRRDEMVRNCSSNVLIRSGITVCDLPRSTHFYYDPEDQQTIFREFDAYIKQKAGS